jgi:hypothetical protein
VPHGPGDLRGDPVRLSREQQATQPIFFHVSDGRLTDFACHTQALAIILSDTTSGDVPPEGVPQMTTSTAAETPYRDCSPSSADSIRALFAILGIGLGFLAVLFITAGLVALLLL